MATQTAAANGATANAAQPPENTASQRLPALTLGEARGALAAPFPGACIGYLPNRLGANSQWAVMFPYVDVNAIQDRLDLVTGPEHWSHEVVAVDATTLACRLRLYEVAHSEIGQGTDRWSQSANAFKRCARHFGVGRYLTQLPAVRLKLGTGIPVNAKGKPYITDELLARLRAGYEQQVRALEDRFGAILPHPGVGAGETEGEQPTHPEVEPDADEARTQTAPSPSRQGEPPTNGESSAGPSATPNPHGARLRTIAIARGVDDAELANLVRNAVAQGAIPAVRARSALPKMLERISEEITERTIELLDMFHPAPGTAQDAPGEPTSVDFGALDPAQAA